MPRDAGFFAWCIRESGQCAVEAACALTMCRLDRQIFSISTVKRKRLNVEQAAFAKQETWTSIRGANHLIHSSFRFAHAGVLEIVTGKAGEAKFPKYLGKKMGGGSGDGGTMVVPAVATKLLRRHQPGGLCCRSFFLVAIP
jgi:hypothetical protein